jgi:hypothetical protein
MTPHKDRRPREYLTPSEVEKLIEAARKTRRYGQRDATAISSAAWTTSAQKTTNPSPPPRPTVKDRRNEVVVGCGMNM